MRALIDLTYNDVALREALLDMVQFKPTMLTRFSRDDLEILDDAGFRFSSPYITQRRAEIKTFLNNHPECMSGDFETLVDKISYLVAKLYKDEAQAKRKQTKRVKEITRKHMVPVSDESSSEDSIQSFHSKRSKTSEKSSKSARSKSRTLAKTQNIKIEEISSDESSSI